jgi:SAM-dependent methyltransferase
MSERGRIHQAAATGFQRQAGAYERGRPAYPSQAIAHLLDRLAIGKGTRVLDLGAGTGKFTRALAEAGAAVQAVEPVASMREEFARHLPGVPVVNGRAEAIPLPDGSFDAVVVAQAFHWFDGRAALAEIRRVLRAGGHLGLIWNLRDEETGWVAELTAIMDPYAGETPRYRTGEWRLAFDDTTLFSPLEARSFVHTQEGPPEMIVDRMASISFIAALPYDEHARVLAQTRELLATHPDTRGQKTISFPYRADVFVCIRR